MNVMNIFNIKLNTGKFGFQQDMKLCTITWENIYKLGAGSEEGPVAHSSFSQKQNLCDYDTALEAWRLPVLYCHWL